MFYLNVNKLREGMRTAQGIYNSKGASYLTKGTKLNKQYINQLRRLGISYINVTSIDPRLNVLPPEDIVHEETRIEAIHKVYEAFETLKYDDSYSTNMLEKISSQLLAELISEKNNLVQATDIRLHDDYTFSHCVNVAILASMLGVLCKFTKKDIITLTLGGFLHDIGKNSISTKILNKPTSLNNEEFLIIKKHPIFGYDTLIKLKSPFAKILATIASQHHERLDGTGYPANLEGFQIHKFSRITAIADVYDALTSQRAYKRPYKPYTAYRIMKYCSEGQFDVELLDLFFDNVAIYPVGTIMKLKTGYAIVKKVKFGFTRTPVVSLFADAQGNLLRRPVDIDLTDCSSDTLERVLEEQEQYSLIMKWKFDPTSLLTD